MKTYRLMKGVIVLALAALPFAFGGCGKDDAEQAEPAGNNTNTPDTPNTPDVPKHNVEFIYDRTMSSIPVDTIAKYAAQPDIDTIYLIPENTHQFGGFTATQLSPYIKALRKRYVVAPTQVFGKGDLFVNSSVEDNTDAYKFFADTLKYNVIRNNAKNM